MGIIAPLAFRMDKFERDMYFNSAVHDVNTSRIRLLEYKSIDMEARIKQNNLIFSGFEELVVGDDCSAIIQQFLNDKLDIDRSSYEMSKAYRFGRKSVLRSRNQIKHRSIMVTFVDPRQVELIPSKAYLLKGTSYGISKDYPKEISDARQELWPAYKEAKARYGPKNVTLKYPAALVIHGETVQNKFPSWHETLKGSRNSNVNERIDARFQFKVTEFTKSTMNLLSQADCQPNRDDVLSDDGSDMEVTIPSTQLSSAASASASGDTPQQSNVKVTLPHRSLFSDTKPKQTPNKKKGHAPAKPEGSPPVSPHQRQFKPLSIYTPKPNPANDQDKPPDTTSISNPGNHDPSS